MKQLIPLLIEFDKKNISKVNKDDIIWYNGKICFIRGIKKIGETHYDLTMVTVGDRSVKLIIPVENDVIYVSKQTDMYPQKLGGWL